MHEPAGFEYMTLRAVTQLVGPPSYMANGTDEVLGSQLHVVLNDLDKQGWRVVCATTPNELLLTRRR